MTSGGYFFRYEFLLNRACGWGENNGQDNPDC